MIALGSKVENYEADLALILLKAIYHHIAELWDIWLTEKKHYKADTGKISLKTKSYRVHIA